MDTKWESVHKQIASEWGLTYDFVQFTRCLVGTKKLEHTVDAVRLSVNEKIRELKQKLEIRKDMPQSFTDSMSRKITRLQGFLIVLRDFDDKKMTEFINLYK